MTLQLTAALETLKSLGSPEEIRALAAKGVAPISRPKINSHIHLPPNFSAFETVEQAVDLACEQEMGIIGISNYYDFTVYGDFVTRAHNAGLFPLFGLEIICLIEDLVASGVKVNDPGNPGKFYICGKGISQFAEPNERASALMETIRRNDSERMAEMTRLLGAVLVERGVDLQLTADDVIAMIVARHGSPRETVYIQERHIAQAYQQALSKTVTTSERGEVVGKALGLTADDAPSDSVAIQNEIRSTLMKAGKPAFVTETFVSFDEARELILALGGIPCYPTLADGAHPICGFEEPVEKLVAELQTRGLYAAEFIPLRNRPEMLKKYVMAMRAAGMIVTAGTEHNTLDLIPLEPFCLEGAAIDEETREIFWEGARVVAAHQHLGLHGHCGYVDADGELNPAWDDPEKRIADLAAYGGALIEKYARR